MYGYIKKIMDSLYLIQELLTTGDTFLIPKKIAKQVAITDRPHSWQTNLS